MIENILKFDTILIFFVTSLQIMILMIFSNVFAISSNVDVSLKIIKKS